MLLGLLGYVGEELLKNTLNLMGSQGENCLLCCPRENVLFNAQVKMSP